jgi:hypothetical protein
VFTTWDTVTTQDLAQYFHIDTDDDAAMAAKSWRWLRGRILALCDIPDSRLRYHIDESR